MITLDFNSKKQYKKLQSYLEDHKEFKFTIETSDDGNLYLPTYIIRGQLPTSIKSKPYIFKSGKDRNKSACYVKTENYEITGIPNNMRETFEDWLWASFTIEDYYYEKYNS